MPKPLAKSGISIDRVRGRNSHGAQRIVLLRKYYNMTAVNIVLQCTRRPRKCRKNKGNKESIVCTVEVEVKMDVAVFTDSPTELSDHLRGRVAATSSALCIAAWPGIVVILCGMFVRCQ